MRRVFTSNMGIVIQGMRNVLRNPVRLLLVVVLLGASLMFVAAMVSLSQSVQTQLNAVHQQVGTGITINYVENNASQFGGNDNGGNGSGGTGGGFFGGGRGFGQATTTPMPSSVIQQVTGVSGVVSAEESVRQVDTDETLQTSTITTPGGRTINLPAMVYGISNGATHFTLPGGSVPTIVAGRSFQSSDANADVAIMGQTMAQANNLNVGSTFPLKGTTVTIIGLYTTTSQFAGNSIILPLATAQSIYSINGVDSITAYAASVEQVQTVATKLKSVLGSSYDIVTQDSLVANAIDSLNVVQNSIVLALIVSVVVAVIVIVFTVVIIVRERNTEIGIMKAIGASHWQVIRQFWGEVLAMSGLGAVVAVLLLVALGPVVSQVFTPSPGGRGGGFGGGRGLGGGFGGGRALFAQASNLSLAPATLNVQTLLIIVGLGVGLAVLTSMIPAWYVARLKPAVVLRSGN